MLVCSGPGAAWDGTHAMAMAMSYVLPARISYSWLQELTHHTCHTCMVTCKLLASVPENDQALVQCTLTPNVRAAARSGLQAEHVVPLWVCSSNEGAETSVAAHMGWHGSKIDQ
jgi:hypothetical protein